MKNIKNKRALLFGGVLCLAFAAIAITIAYNRDSSVLANNFELGGIYKTVTTEEFVGPDNWAPCQEVPKTVTVKNEGSVDVAVRISYEEYWKDKDDYDLSPDLDNIHLVDIVFQNENDWELENGYYYYKHTLAPGESSNSLFKEVVLNCEADFGGDSVCHETGTGIECETPEPASSYCWMGGCVSFDYRAAKYHLDIKVETIQADKKELWHQIGFAVAGEQDLIRLSEKGKPVYMYPKLTVNNYIIWSDLCWRAVRTTYSGGVKMVYAGNAIVENGVQTCSLQNTKAVLNGVDSFSFNTTGNVGYMYGDEISTQVMELADDDTTTSLVLSNGVSRNGNTYTLDTTSGQYIEGPEIDRSPEAQTRYHYFCTDGASSCDSSKIGYLISISDVGDETVTNGNISYTLHYDTRRLTYYPLGGYDDIEDFKERTIWANEHDSSAKTAIESWFEANNLDDDSLEDAIFCNDRSISSGPLAGPDENLGGADKYAFSSRENNPTLDCARKSDSFTKDDTVNGNGKLSHKVGLLTADEAVFAELSYNGTGSIAMCAGGVKYSWIGKLSGAWFMTPTRKGNMTADRDACAFSEYNPTSGRALYPVVSLKADARVVSGNGKPSNPYIIE